jgi:hypothetical protein
LDPNGLRDVFSPESHILCLWKEIIEIEVLDVNAGCSSTWGGYHVVEEAFDCDKVRRTGRFVSWKVNEIAADGAPDPIRISLVFSIIGHDSNVCGFLARWDFSRVDELARTSALDGMAGVVRDVSLEQATPFFAKSQLPSGAHGAT